MNRGGSGASFDFRPVLSHPVLLVTLVLGVPGWLVAFVGMIVAEADTPGSTLHTLWFGIFLELFYMVGIILTLGTDSIATNRLQLSVFGAVAIVFSVSGIDRGIYSGVTAFEALAAGWFLLTVSNILWTLYFTSDEDSAMYALLNSFGNGGLSPPSRGVRRGNRASSMVGIGNGGAYSGAYSGGTFPNSFANPSVADINGSAPSGLGGAPSMGGGKTSTSIRSGNVGPIGGGREDAAVGPGGGQSLMGNAQQEGDVSGQGDYGYKAKALYAYTASADDPNEISFAKGEILEIVDNSGKWWQARKADGATGIVPSNYLQII